MSWMECVRLDLVWYALCFIWQDRLNERLAGLSAPTHDLPPQDTREKKFTGRCRLYIGNLTNDVTEDEITQLFQPYGESAELFVNKEKNFAFIRLVSDYILIVTHVSCQLNLFFYDSCKNVLSVEYKQWRKRRNYRMIVVIKTCGYISELHISTVSS